MDTFERAARLFDELTGLPAAERDARLANEPDAEVRGLVAAMLAGDQRPLDALSEGLPVLRGVIEGFTETSDAQDAANDDTGQVFELADGHFRIDGILAKGGMGIVLRGHDDRIGRDVAIKVLRARAASRPEARLRFIEEAQVAGQLEHPGIVPIHALGNDDAGRPYFAMKLVEGRTLSDLLRSRPDPMADRPRLLAHLLRAAEAVAYAHARGVIHRDLKPANLMVGAFGEVQVLDWGLAKVLHAPAVDAEATGSKRGNSPSAPETVRTTSGSESGSLSGTVMGTPGYMPPEQALGEVDRLDQRADVFSLGAILCEVLTGDPPFVGPRDTALDSTRRANLLPAHAQLAECGADPELIAHVTRCLSADPDDRPPDAAAVAAALERSFSEAERRAHNAEVAAERAASRALAERRARRVTLALSAVIALFLVALVGGGLWLRFTEQQQRDRRSAEWANALDIVEERLAVARNSEPAELGPWDAATAALDAALTHSTGDQADIASVHAELLTRTNRLRDALTEERSAAAARAERDAADAALRRRLDEIRAPTGDGLDPWDYRRMERAYRVLFRGLDLNVDEYDQTAHKLASHRLGKDLGLALDEWSLLHHVLAKQPTRERTVFSTRLLWLAVYADAHPVRNRIRRAIIADDVEQVEALAADTAGIPPESAVLLAGALRLLGRIESAIDVIRRMVRRHPDDYWLSFHGAIALRSLARSKRSPERDAMLNESVSYFRGALAARPNSLEARHLLGQALGDLGLWKAARVEFEELVRREPKNGHWRAHVGNCMVKLAGYAAARAVLEQASTLAPNDAWALDLHARALLDSGNPWAAVELRRRAFRAKRDARFATSYAQTLGDVGDLAEAWLIRQHAVELAPEDWRVLYGASYTAGVFNLRERGVELLRRAVELAPNAAEVHCNLADVLRELGQFDEALECYRRGHELGTQESSWSYPSARWIDETERAIRLHHELDIHVARGIAELDETSALALAEVAVQSGRTKAASDWYAELHARTSQLSVQDLDLALEAAARTLADEASPSRIEVHGARALRWMEETHRRLMADFRSHPRREHAAVRNWLMSWRMNPLLEPLRTRHNWPAPLEARAASMWATVDADLHELEAVVKRLAERS